MVEIRPYIPPDDVRALQQAISDLQDITGRSASDAVTYAAMKIASSGRAASKMGKKNRASIDNPKYVKGAGRVPGWARAQYKAGKNIPAEFRATIDAGTDNSPFLIVFLRQGGAPSYHLPSWIKKDTRREIKPVKQGGTRGLAKTIWNVMAGKAAAMKGGVAVKQGDKYVLMKTATIEGGGVRYSFRLNNKLKYLEIAYPGITRVAINKGTKALRTEIKKNLKRMQRAA